MLSAKLAFSTLLVVLFNLICQPSSRLLMGSNDIGFKTVSLFLQPEGNAHNNSNLLFEQNKNH